MRYKIAKLMPTTEEGPVVSTLRTRVTRGACGLWHTYRNCRYALLFYSLLLTLAVVPLRRALGFSHSLLELFLAINLLAAVVPIRGRKSRWILLLCLVVAFVGRGGTSWLDQAALVPMYLALWTVVALLAAASALRFALGARVETASTSTPGSAPTCSPGFSLGSSTGSLNGPGQARSPYPVWMLRAMFHSQ